MPYMDTFCGKKKPYVPYVNSLPHESSGGTIPVTTEVLHVRLAAKSVAPVVEYQQSVIHMLTHNVLNARVG